MIRPVAPPTAVAFVPAVAAAGAAPPVAATPAELARIAVTGAADPSSAVGADGDDDDTRRRRGLVTAGTAAGSTGTVPRYQSPVRTLADGHAALAPSSPVLEVSAARTGASALAPIRAGHAAHEARHALGQAGTAASGASLVVPGGTAGSTQVPLATAIELGLVVLGADGKVAWTPKGEAYAAAAAGPQPAPVASQSPGGAAPAGAAAKPDDPNAAWAPTTMAAGLGTVASAAFLGAGLINIFGATKTPAWTTWYFAARGVDKFTGKHLLPDTVRSGLVGDAINFLLVGQMLWGNWKDGPAQLATFRENVASLHAANPALHGAGLLLQAFTKVKPDAPTPKPEPPKGPLTIGQKLLPLAKPIQYMGFTLSSVAELMELPAYFEHGHAAGLVNTKTGRSAMIDALGGVTMLAALWLPASPMQFAADVLSNVFWLGGMVNEKGWLDALGADPQPRTT